MRNERERAPEAGGRRPDLIVLAELLPESRLTDLLDENDQLIAIFVKSISTAKGRKQEC